MTHRGPLITLSAVAILFAALLAADFVVHPTPDAAVSAAVPASTSAPATPAPPGTVSTYPSAATPSGAPTPRATERDDEDRFPQRAVYVGRSEDGRLAVAVAVLGDRAAAYVCDGRSREAWLRGRVEADEVRLTSEHGYRLSAELDDKRLVGEVRSGGRRWAFEIHRAEPPAGLYRAEGSRTTVGWIRLPDGSVVGIATNDDGASGPAPALGPDQEVQLDGHGVRADPVAGDDKI